MNGMLLTALKATFSVDFDLMQLYKEKLENKTKITYTEYLDILFKDCKETFLELKIEDFKSFIHSKITVDAALFPVANNTLSEKTENTNLSDSTNIENRDNENLALSNSSENIESDKTKLNKRKPNLTMSTDTKLSKATNIESIEDPILKSIQDKIVKDDELVDFYRHNLQPYTEEGFTDYVKKIYSNHQDDLSAIKINDFKDFILARIRNTRTRYKKVQDFSGRLINFPLLLDKRFDYIKAAFDNELLKTIITIVLDTYKQKETIVRPVSLQGLFTATEQTSLFNMESLITIENNSAYLSDKEFTRQQEIIQPFILSNSSNLEVVYVGNNQRAYAKSKTLDKRDQKIMDFFVNQYKQTMFYDSGSEGMLFPLSTISSIAYGKTFGKHNKQYMQYTENRLVKMSCQGFKERKINAEDINDYNIIRLFEVQFSTKNGVRYAAIDLSSSLKRDIKNNNFLELYSDKMSEIKNDFTSIFAEFLANQRVSTILQGNDKREKEYPYEVIKTSVRLPFLRSKPKNLAAIKFSLEELKSIDFIIENYKVNKNYISIKYLPLDYFELKALNLKDKAKDLEVKA